MNNKIIDLTMTIEEGMQTFPTHWHPFVEITQLGRHGLENRETRKIVMGTHTGTHIDAPRHFIPSGKTVDQLDNEQLIGPATVLDFTDFGPGMEITAKHLAKKMGTNPADRVLLRFDWDRFLGTMDYYNHSPFLSEEASHWLVDNGCILLGMDTAMPDNPVNGKNGPKDSPNHKILLGNGVVLLEYLVNLKAIYQPTFKLIVAPLKIRDGDGAPSRVFAILD
jgi:arylformamidase